MKINKKERQEIRRIVCNKGFNFREFIAKEAEFAIKNMLEDAQYVGLIEGIGRLAFLAALCMEDSYWSEKVVMGFYKGRNDINAILDDHDPMYSGYRYNASRDFKHEITVEDK